jgi:hypothetical protein
MKHSGLLAGAVLALAFAGGAAAQAGARGAQPHMLRDANGAPVLLYGSEARGSMVVTQETFAGEPVIVVKEPAVRDGSGHSIGDGSGGTVQSQAAAPMSERAVTAYEVDRYLLVPSASTGAGTAPSMTVVPAPVAVDPGTE